MVMTRPPKLFQVAGLFGSWMMAMVFATASAHAEASREPMDRPNFVVIFVDDMGYGDIGPTGSEKNRTPHLDQMAEQGARFTSFYVTSGVCSPSRASLMTGCYPRRIGMHEGSRGTFVLVPKDKRGLNPDEVTVAEVLKERGYATAAIGKWHLGDQPRFMPRQQGFDYYYGIPFSNDMGSLKPGELKHGKLPELPLLRNEKVIEAPVNLNTVTKRYTQEAVRFIRQHQDQPFFVYLPHTMVHTPLASSEQFAGRSPHGPYSDAVEEIDWSTGQILDTLEQLDLDKNTLVIFTSDNGATSRGSNKPFSGGKGGVREGAMRMPCVMWWPGTIDAGRVCDEITSTLDILPTFAELAGGQTPQDRVIDGRDISPLILGKPNAETPHEAFYYYFMGQLRCVRSGKWKLHRGLDPKIGGWTGNRKSVVEAKLYNLDTDPGEKHNVIDQHPKVAKRLRALAERARNDIGDYQHEGENTREPGYVAEPEYIMKEQRASPTEED
jgi:arylsulfatase A-like enzyme